MKQTLVIGSTVVDVLLGVPSIPRRGEDVNITDAEYKIGGCAYNVFKILSLFEIPALLCSPVGQGMYGDMVRKRLEKEGIKPFVNLEQENGCCYCLVESDGERSFLSYHGAEYLFQRSWMEKVDFSKTSDIFICGLEVEDSGGNEIIEFVYEHPELELYFSPGPRIRHIQKDRMDRLIARRDKNGRGPLLHLNETEALRYSGKHTFEEAADFFTQKTANSVIITIGKRGCYCLDVSLIEESCRDKPKGEYIPGFSAVVLDTVGAGDAHCGAIIACQKKGKSLRDACTIANKTGAAVVSIKGAVLDRLPDSLN